MMSEQTVQSAMSIILHAGDARVACKEALDAISEADFETAEVKLKEAQARLLRRQIWQEYRMVFQKISCGAAL